MSVPPPDAGATAEHEPDFWLRLPGYVLGAWIQVGLAALSVALVMGLVLPLVVLALKGPATDMVRLVDVTFAVCLPPSLGFGAAFVTARLPVTRAPVVICPGLVFLVATMARILGVHGGRSDGSWFLFAAILTAFAFFGASMGLRARRRAQRRWLAHTADPEGLIPQRGGT